MAQRKFTHKLVISYYLLFLSTLCFLAGFYFALIENHYVLVFVFTAILLALWSSFVFSNSTIHSSDLVKVLRLLRSGGPPH